MERVNRIDRGGGLRSPQRRADGSIVVDGYLTRAGVFTYFNPDGTERKEYRPESEVFSPSSMAAYRGVPFTDEHPPGLVRADNATKYTRGTVLEAARRDGNHLAAPIVVHDAATVKKLESGKTQLSCGYACDLDRTPGITPDGERYDAIQRNIRPNHVALVHVARAGADAKVRMDSADDGAELAKRLDVAVMRLDSAATASPRATSIMSIDADVIRAMRNRAAAIRHDNDLSAAARDKLPSKDFAAGGHEPIENAAHVRAAMSRFEETKWASDAQKRAAFNHILAKAKQFGVDSSGFEDKRPN